MRDDDNTLRGIDLDAWAPPPPPAADALADAVLLRMREPARSSAREPAERARRRRWPIAAAAAALAVAAAAAAVLVVVRRGTVDPPAHGHGEVFAERASHLELGPSSAELDAGAEVRWQRDGWRIAAAQPRGGALWRVAAEDTLVIDAGATVASVEASGASLRVEVQMNLSDARVLGASAAVAATVALITVTVYEGNVKVTSAGQTVRVEPGAAVEVRPRQVADDALRVGGHQTPTQPSPPQPLPDILDQAAIARGLEAVTPTITSCGDGSYIGTIEARVTVAPDGGVTDVKLRPARTGVDACVELALRGARFDATKRGSVFTESFKLDSPFRPCNSGALDKEARDHEAAGQHAAALATYERWLQCTTDPAVLLRATVAACAARSTSAAASHYAQLGKAQQARAVMACARHRITAQELSCIHEELGEKGREQYASGQYAAALLAFERAYACKPETQYAEKAFIAACNVPNVAKAAQHFRRMSPMMKQRAIMICVRNGITEDMLTGAPSRGP